jgi:hypothetical protein
MTPPALFATYGTRSKEKGSRIVAEWPMVTHALKGMADRRMEP